LPRASSFARLPSRRHSVMDVDHPIIEASLARTPSLEGVTSRGHVSDHTRVRNRRAARGSPLDRRISEFLRDNGDRRLFVRTALRGLTTESPYSLRPRPRTLPCCRSPCKTSPSSSPASSGDLLHAGGVEALGLLTRSAPLFQESRACFRVAGLGMPHILPVVSYIVSGTRELRTRVSVCPSSCHSESFSERHRRARGLLLACFLKCFSRIFESLSDPDQLRPKLSPARERLFAGQREEKSARFRTSP